jgi:hypothetical protein
MIFGGWCLQDCHTLSDYNIQDKTTIHIVMRSVEVTAATTYDAAAVDELARYTGVSREKCATCVAMPDRLGTTPPRACQRIAQRIAASVQATLVPADLVHENGGDANNSRLATFVNENTERNGQLTVLVKYWPPTRVTSGITSVTYTLEVEATDTVGRLKAKIQEQQGHPTELQFLVFGTNAAAKSLEDCHTLSDYNIQDKRLVFLVVRPASCVVAVKAAGGALSPLLGEPSLQDISSPQNGPPQAGIAPRSASGSDVTAAQSHAVNASQRPECESASPR